MYGVLARPLLLGLVALTATGSSLAVGYPYQDGHSASAVDQMHASEAPSFTGITAAELEHSFYFTRAIYGGGGFGRRGGSRWDTDFPDADQWIVNVLGRLTGLDVYPRENAIALNDPELRSYPFIYALEMHDMVLPDDQVQALRDYLLAGGFMMVDDFWGAYEWEDFEREISRVLPEFDIVELPMDHEIFSSYYLIEEIVQVPVVDRGVYGGPTWENGGVDPHCRGIFDENGRLMVVINWNTDIGDAWEHAENPRYPLRYSTYAYQMAANTIVYAMTH